MRWPAARVGTLGADRCKEPDCNGTFDFGDINPFVYHVTTGDCDCPGDSERGGEQRTPEEPVKLLADNVAPELYHDRVWIVGEAINAQDDDASRQYWEEAYAALTQ